MPGKKQLFLLGTFLSGLIGAESTILPGGTIAVTTPDGWQRIAGSVATWRGPGRDPASAPRIAVSASDSPPDIAAASLRDAILRVSDGCTVLDDDEIPLGGRVWRRLRLRFVAGPMEFGQSAWIGSVGERTIVVVLSAPDDAIGAHLATGAAVVSLIRPAR